MFSLDGERLSKRAWFRFKLDSSLAAIPGELQDNPKSFCFYLTLGLELTAFKSFPPWANWVLGSSLTFPFGDF